MQCEGCKKRGDVCSGSVSTFGYHHGCVNCYYRKEACSAACSSPILDLGGVSAPQNSPTSPGSPSLTSSCNDQISRLRQLLTESSSRREIAEAKYQQAVRWCDPALRDPESPKGTPSREDARRLKASELDYREAVWEETTLKRQWDGVEAQLAQGDFSYTSELEEGMGALAVSTPARGPVVVTISNF